MSVVSVKWKAIYIVIIYIRNVYRVYHWRLSIFVKNIFINLFIYQLLTFIFMICYINVDANSIGQLQVRLNVYFLNCVCVCVCVCIARARACWQYVETFHLRLLVIKKYILTFIKKFILPKNICEIYSSCERTSSFAKF